MLNNAVIGSRPCEGVLIFSLDWATRMRDEEVCVMSGFQSPLEKEALNILLKGTSPLILVLARRM